MFETNILILETDFRKSNYSGEQQNTPRINPLHFAYMGKAPYDFALAENISLINFVRILYTRSYSHKKNHVSIFQVKTT